MEKKLFIFLAIFSGLVQAAQDRLYKVKTSDNKILELPEQYFDKLAVVQLTKKAFTEDASEVGQEIDLELNIESVLLEKLLTLENLKEETAIFGWLDQFKNPEELLTILINLGTLNIQNDDLQFRFSSSNQLFNYFVRQLVAHYKPRLSSNDISLKDDEFLNEINKNRSLLNVIKNSLLNTIFVKTDQIEELGKVEKFKFLPQGNAFYIKYFTCHQYGYDVVNNEVRSFPENKLLINLGNAVENIAWSPNGRSYFIMEYLPKPGEDPVRGSKRAVSKIVSYPEGNVQLQFPDYSWFPNFIWSPKGDAFIISGKTGANNIYQIRSFPQNAILKDLDSYTDVFWSPKGDALYMQKSIMENYRIIFIDAGIYSYPQGEFLQDFGQWRLKPFGWSPKGNAFYVENSNQVRGIQFNNGKILKLGKDFFNFKWSPDGKAFFVQHTYFGDYCYLIKSEIRSYPDNQVLLTLDSVVHFDWVPQSNNKFCYINHYTNHRNNLVCYTSLLEIAKNDDLSIQEIMAIVLSKDPVNRLHIINKVNNIQERKQAQQEEYAKKEMAGKALQTLKNWWNNEL